MRGFAVTLVNSGRVRPPEIGVSMDLSKIGSLAHLS